MSFCHPGWFDCWDLSACSKTPALGGPARACPRCPGAPAGSICARCHGNQHPPADRASGMVSLLFYLGLAFAFVFCAPSLPSPGAQPSGQGQCLGQKQRWWAPGSLDAALRVLAEPRWDEPAPLCGQVLSGVGPCPTAGWAICLLSSWGKAKRNSRPESQGTLARSEGVCGSESDPTQPLSCYSLGEDGFGPC